MWRKLLLMNCSFIFLFRLHNRLRVLLCSGWTCTGCVLSYKRNETEKNATSSGVLYRSGEILLRAPVEHVRRLCCMCFDSGCHWYHVRLLGGTYLRDVRHLVVRIINFLANFIRLVGDVSLENQGKYFKFSVSRIILIRFLWRIVRRYIDWRNI